MILVIMIAVFLMGRNSRKPEIIIEKPDVSKFEKKIDSILQINKCYQDSINHAYASIVEIARRKDDNIRRLKNELDEIKKFTPTSRNRWNDSVRRAAGLK